MTEIFKNRMTAEIDDEFVVFLIGMRINKWWKVHKWFPLTMAMPKMLKELYANPDMGFISQQSWGGRTTIMVQYWKSFEHLEAYAKNRNAAHLPAWAEFNKKVSSNGDVGIWHETYQIKRGCHESIYNNMPRFGLANAARHVDITQKSNSAKKRMAQKSTEKPET